ncbi:MAG: class I SAM-dependent methyltransferase [Planctomycetaceae bacterium]
MGTGASIPFDRAAEYYDETRGLSEDAVAWQTRLLADELRGRGRVLEAGVGTGQVALPLAEAGIAMTGLDLSRPMLDRLIAKAGGRIPFPLVLGDATRLPFPDDVFGGAVLRWVLHLVPAWRRLLAELVRVVEPGGVAVLQVGGYGGRRAEIQERFGEVAGIPHVPAGLMWGATEELDDAMRGLGATVRLLPTFREEGRGSLEGYLRALEDSRYSWTWKADPDLVRRAAAEVRAWAEERWGPLAEVPEDPHEVAWRAYDLG